MTVQRAPLRLARVPRPPRKPRADWEGQEQAQLFGILKIKHPEVYRLAYHVPNGGHRHPAVAGKLRAQGVKAGVSDIVLPMARGGWFGLYIEFKATPPHDAAVSQEQTAFLLRVEQQGYYATVCRGVDDALRVIEQYMAQPRTEVVR
ncbi:VRR-NUC domain-containing protein [Pseudomonas delhiensis]|uniref:VRR-NUC domain-containing protein n=1 Tax=Pseudomonas delhiensis TaxID=366289 RepID=UPI00315A038A